MAILRLFKNKFTFLQNWVCECFFSYLVGSEYSRHRVCFLNCVLNEQFCDLWGWEGWKEYSPHNSTQNWGWLVLDWLVLKSKKAISERFVKIWARQLRGNEFQNKNLGHLNSLLFRKCTKNFDLKSPFVKLTLWILWMPSTIKLTCTSLWYTCYVVCFDGVRPDHMYEGVDLMNSLIDILCSCSPSPPMGKHICQHQGKEDIYGGIYRISNKLFWHTCFEYIFVFFGCLCSSEYQLICYFGSL